MSIHLSKRHPTALVKFFIVLLFFSTFQVSLHADVDSATYELNKEFLKSFFSDSREVLTAPKNWRKKDLYVLSACLASGVSLFFIDQDIQDWVEDNKSPTSKDISHLVSPLGHGAFLGGLMTALYASGEIFNDVKLRKTALLSFESWMISGVIVSGLKFLIGRRRPQGNGDGFNFHPFSFRSRDHSFPSGHASSAFAVATVIANHSEEFSIDFLAYNLAALAALSRIHDSKHWASDVFIGAAIGYFVGKKVSDLHKKKDKENIQVDFRVTSHRKTITLSIYF